MTRPWKSTRRWALAPALALALGLTLGGMGAGCSGSPAPRGGPNGTNPAPRFVLVRDDAWLRIAPDDAAEGARASSRPATSPGAPPGVSVYRLVRDAGDWLAVRGPGERASSGQCFSRRFALDAFGVKLWVRREGLARTTTREVTSRFADGTFATLSPGVVLEPAPTLSTPERAVYTVYGGGVLFNTWLDADAVGYAYVASPPRDSDRETPGLVLRSTGSARFGGSARVGSYGALSPSLPAVDREDGRDGTRVTVRTHCFALRVQVDPADLVSPAGALFGALGPAPVASPSVARGTRIYWADGRYAGHMRRDASLGPEVAPQGGRRCFSAALRNGGRPDAPGHSLRICFDPADVR